MKIRAPTPIRIVKNLRVCEDCHTATKLISRDFEVEFTGIETDSIILKKTLVLVWIAGETTMLLFLDYN
ncbi:hypothetical protein Fmac_006619 [Flemingia macrophylla]|uniref:DYW domain-containing protein n=1 Tax=Flemingia macrophylla TaxID=520843 RepID=A0ABD1NB51_9FABA